MSPPSDRAPSAGAVKPSQAVVEAVAAREGVDVTDVEPPAYEPLYVAINPEALDELFRSVADEGTAAPVRVTFEYEGYEVTVFGDGRVDLAEQSNDDEHVEDPIDD